MTVRRSYHDVVVVGARSAGASTAMLLARAGHDVRCHRPFAPVARHELHPRAQPGGRRAACPLGASRRHRGHRRAADSQRRLPRRRRGEPSHHQGSGRRRLPARAASVCPRRPAGESSGTLRCDGDDRHGRDGRLANRRRPRRGRHSPRIRRHGAGTARPARRRCGRRVFVGGEVARRRDRREPQTKRRRLLCVRRRCALGRLRVLPRRCRHRRGLPDARRRGVRLADPPDRGTRRRHRWRSRPAHPAGCAPSGGSSPAWPIASARASSRASSEALFGFRIIGDGHSGRAGPWSATPATTATRSPATASPTHSATPSCWPRRRPACSPGRRPMRAHWPGMSGNAMPRWRRSFGAPSQIFGVPAEGGAPRAAGTAQQRAGRRSAGTRLAPDSRRRPRPRVCSRIRLIAYISTTEEPPLHRKTPQRKTTTERRRGRQS